MINKIIRYLYYSLFFLTPLVMSSLTSELFEFNKMLAIYFITVLVLLFWSCKMVIEKRIIFKRSPFDLPIFLFLMSQIASTFFSIDPHTSLFGYYGRFNGGLLSIISYLILYYGFISTIADDMEKSDFIHKLLKVSLICSFITILWGLTGKLGFDLSCLVFTGQLNNTCWTNQFRPAQRMFSTLGQPNWLGAYLAIHFFLALFFFVKTRNAKNIRATIYMMIYLFLNFTSILFTRSRSALLSVFAGLVIFLFFHKLLHLRKKEFIIAIILLFFSILLFKTGIGQIDRLLTFNLSKSTQQKSVSVQATSKIQDSGVSESFDIRKIVWKGALLLGLKYPVFGSGVETFAYSYYFVRPKEHNLTSEWDFLYNKAHNEYLNYLATTGFVGLMSYLFMIGAVIILLINQIAKKKNQKLDKSTDDRKLLLTCLSLSYLAILITNFFGFSTTTTNLFFYLIPAIFVVDTSSLVKNSPHKTYYPLNRTQKILLGLNIFIASILIFQIIFYFIADVIYAQSDSAAKMGDFNKSSNLLRSALTLRSDHVYKDKLSYNLANLAYLAAYQKQKDTAKKLIVESDGMNVESLRESPQNVLYWKTRAKNYYLYYQLSLDPKQIEAGIQALDRAVKLSPTDPKIYYSRAIYYSLLSDEQKDQEKKDYYQVLSFRNIDQSISLKSDFMDAYMLKAQLLKKAGKKEEAKDVFRFILQRFDPNNQEVKKELEAL